MPLDLSRCGSLGGDVEMTATVKTLALRNPDTEFWLVGRNTGEDPTTVGLPTNVVNPWMRWIPELRDEFARVGLNVPNLSVEQHRAVGEVFDRITLPTLRTMDHFVLWAGQHGTTNSPLPSIKDPSRSTKPHDWSAKYVAPLVRAVNLWRGDDPWQREEVWLNSDPRNYLKLRDLQWPLRHPVLAQHTYTHRIKHSRSGLPVRDGDFEEWSAIHGVGLDEPSHIDLVWRSSVDNVYSRLEVNGLVPGTPFGDLLTYDNRWDDRGHFGLFMNETRRYVRSDVMRSQIVRDWVLPVEPVWMHGTWSAAGQKEVGREIKPVAWDRYVPQLHSVRCTFTSPASGTGWATAKPWEAFAAGTVCFFHPGYDTQDNILGDAPADLREWLRVSSPDELRKRVGYLSTGSGRSAWHWLVDAQRRHFNTAVRELRFARLIEERICA